MTLTKIPADDRFDLASWVGQRKATFRFSLVDGVTNQPLRTLTPIKGSIPTLMHDTSRAIPRSLSLNLGVADTAAINTIRDRVLVSMVIGGETWPLGRYMFVDNSRVIGTGGNLSSPALTDEMFILDQPREDSFAALVTVSTAASGFGEIVTPLEQIDQTMTRVLRGTGITARIDATPYTSIGSWNVGTSAVQILNNLATDGDYFAPWFNNLGRLRIMRTYDPAYEVPDFDFDASNKVIRGSITASDNLLDAPNRIIVVSNGVASDVSAQAPVVGTFDVPLSAPHSSYNRGFVVPRIETRQVESIQQATAIARTIALRETAFEIVELATPPDPRHDSYNVIQWDNKRWLETRWSMELIEGGSMQHTLQRVYT